jgi:beta-fructofuranosidase
VDDMTISRRDFLKGSAAAAVAPAWMRFLPRDTDPATAALCHKLASDPLRPQYHLLPAKNWMNDPNGPIFFRGRYHMFHQYNPDGPTWGNMHWAHATSPDMIHWRHEPIALSPTPNGPDRDGVFSGSAVLDHGRPTLTYTGVAPPAHDAEATLRDGVHTWRETQCLAVAEDDDLRRWKKLPEPVIAAPPAGLEITGFRDPCLWREGGKWMLIVGSGIRGKGGAILLYTSSNLRDWMYLHPLVEGTASKTNSTNPVDSGDMWECPDFFPLGNKHLLLISTKGKVHWKVGTYVHQRFTPEKEGIVDWGAYYAAKTMLDARGNRILWGWITETRSNAELMAAGWAGAMSLPRTLSLNQQNELVTAVTAAHILRKSHEGASMPIYERGPEPPRETTRRRELLDAVRIHDLSAELRLIIRPKSDEFTLRLQSDGGDDFATISCATKSGSRHIRVNDVTAPLGQEGRPSVELQLFLDGSILELFANLETSLTARIYQVPSGPLRLKLDDRAELISLNSWRMQPISNDRLTGSLCS